MTDIQPRIGTIDFGNFRDDYWRYNEVVSAVYTPGMTANETLEEVTRWITRKLVPYLRANFQSLESSWESQVEGLTTSVQSMVSDAIGAMTQEDFVEFALSQTSQKNAITGWYHVDNYGAKGDGVTKDHTAIQKAIDAANAEYVATGVRQRVFFSPKLYLVGAQVTQNPGYALLLKSGVELYGSGTIKTAPGTIWTGTDFAILRSADEITQDCGIRDLTFDGNRDSFANVPGAPASIKSCNNITLRTVVNCKLVNVTSVNSVATGIMVAGRSDNLVKTLIIDDCRVSSCNVIGIQVSQFDGIEITNNHISWTLDNAIDIYGEPSSHTGNSTGTNFTINDNSIHDCGNGIFPETVAKGVIANNRMRNLGDSGIHVNRINAEPNEILIVGNQIYGCQSGVIVTGDTGGVTIRDNVFGYYNKAGVTLAGSNGTNVSQVYIMSNTMNGNSDTIPMILVPAANQVANILISGNLTKNRNRALDFVNYCTNNANISKKASMAPGDVLA